MSPMTDSSVKPLTAVAALVPGADDMMVPILVRRGVSTPVLSRPWLMLGLGVIWGLAGEEMRRWFAMAITSYQVKNKGNIEDMVDHCSYTHNLTSCKIKAWKIQALTGFEHFISAIPVQCSTNWAVKPTESYMVMLWVCNIPADGEECNWIYDRL